MLIIFSILFLIYSLLLYIGIYKILPFKLNNDKDYQKAAKSIGLLGAFLLFIGVFTYFKEIDLFAIIMASIVIILIIIKIIYNVNRFN